VIRGRTTEYLLELGPWGPMAKSNTIRVSRVTFDYIRPGDTVNLVLRRGALGMKWYYMLSWQRDQPARNDSSVSQK
jgi:hypothetical protein